MSISIENLSAVEQAMTPGDWLVSVDDGLICSTVKWMDQDTEVGNVDFCEEDVEGIIAMRNAYPKLIAVVRAALAWQVQRGENLIHAVRTDEAVLEAESPDTRRARFEKTIATSRAITDALKEFAP